MLFSMLKPPLYQKAQPCSYEQKAAHHHIYSSTQTSVLAWNTHAGRCNPPQQRDKLTFPLFTSENWDGNIELKGGMNRITLREVSEMFC